MKHAPVRRSFEDYMLPALKGLQVLDQKSENASEGVHIRRLRDWIKDQLGLTKEETTILIPSGRITEFIQRVSWAVHGMLKAELIKRVGHGKYKILEEGEKLLMAEPEKIDKELLRGYPSYVLWQNEITASSRVSRISANAEGDRVDTVNDAEEDPLLLLEKAVEYYNRTLERELLDLVMQSDYSVLERLVVDLLIRLGYGDGNPERGYPTRLTGDGGIDGVIEEDSLGLEKILIQAKRYNEDRGVGPDTIQSFIGAMDQRGASKGVFVTTSKFTDSAKTVVREVTNKYIALIDGAKLARLMRENKIGVRDVTAYWKMIIDESYFDDSDES